MAVIRVHKTEDYTIMSNTHFREKNMSLKAMGLLSLMLSLPDDWDYSVMGLTTLSKDGKDSVMSALNELEKFGYLKRSCLNDECGRFAGYDYDIYEQPQAADADEPTETPYAEKPYAEKPNMVKQGVGKQGVENQGLEFQGVENQGQLNTNIQNTNKKERKADSFDDILDKYIEDNIPLNDRKTIRDLLGEWLKVRKAKRAAMTSRAITLNLNRLKGLANESGMSIAQYLEAVIMRGWQAFFAIHEWGSACSTVGKSRAATSGALEHNYTSEQLRSFFSDLHDFDNLCDKWDL